MQTQPVGRWMDGFSPLIYMRKEVGMQRMIKMQSRWRGDGGVNQI